MEPLANRRRAEREPAVANRSQVTWWEGSSSYESSARLIDISLGGALLISDTPPPLDQSVWVRVEEPAGTDWVKANVVRRIGANETGLSFPEPCPDDLFLAATLGINPGAILGALWTPEPGGDW